MSRADENQSSQESALPAAVHELTESVREASSVGLPFLVTHWLANYSSAADSESTPDDSRAEAIQKLHHAASEIASAFSTLGAFGMSGLPSNSLSSSAATISRPRNATYSDVARSWRDVSPQQLELLAEAAASSTLATRNAASNMTPTRDLLQAAYEASYTINSGERRLRDAGVARDSTETAPTAVSILERPPLLAWTTNSAGGTNQANFATSNQSSSTLALRELPVAVASDFERVDGSISRLTRQVRDEQEQRKAREVELRDVENAIERQEQMKQSLVTELQEQCDALDCHRASSSQESENSVLQTNHIDEIRSRLQTCERVIEQLGHKRSVLSMAVHRNSAPDSSNDPALTNQKLAAVVQQYGDPFRPEAGRSLVSRLATQSHLVLVDASRQYGVRGSLQLHGRVAAGIPKRGSVSSRRRAILSSRMSHVITVNAHLSFPVFCVRFDRTGRYFLTGSDDSLVKLFCVGVGQSEVNRKKPDGSRDLRFCLGANEQSAVLVCTLRGHAGVICDIAVNSDNSFLATASGDGDCRIWGLKDGCPIAILRGHVGGANTVSWSSLTPYRLVTAGDDGFCRMWDIREAALKRYGAYVGNRKEYTLEDSVRTSRVENIDETTTPHASVDGASVESVMLPPLPLREGAPAAELQPPPLPPLPPAAHPVGAHVVDNGADEDEPGAFVANDMIDEGVRLLSKMQHGETVAEQNGPGTRSRRKAVRIICIARCPLGGHFVTGSDDGVCRVWLDYDDPRVERADTESTHIRRGTEQRRSTRSSQSQDQGRKLADLTGHMNPITDLYYSHAGDRILSASHKDGVARVWSWGKGADPNAFTDVKQIALRLPRPRTNSRRESNASAQTGSGAVCDVAIWTADDSKVVTSQCCPVKTTSTEIVPGSQYIFIWDSWSGHCLLGISGAHSAQCQVIVPHPSEPSIFCSAGADGLAKVWDIEKGSCLLSHENKVEFGPVGEQGDRGHPSGYLDGCFSPDGLSLVLSDDKGRFTLLGTGERSDGSRRQTYSWLNEQYFASDYYDLLYEESGYCVEKGSGRPPHLAPRSARCTHSGSSWAGDLDEVYGKLEGPLPLDQERSRIERQSIRSLQERRRIDLQQHLLLAGEPRFSRVGEFDPERTILVSGSGGKLEGFLSQNQDSGSQERAARPSGRSRQTTRALSSNYNWIDYDDTRDEDAMLEGDDSADEEFSPRNGRAVTSHDEDSDSLPSDFGSSDEEQNARSRRRRRRDEERERQMFSAGEQPTRVSQRQAGRSRYVVPDSDEDFDEYDAVISTNNTPSGPHVEDFTIGGHYFRLPDGARVHRRWLKRTESVKGYSGRKTYAPQVGDSVVYIPQAHKETLECFPILQAPWTSWPSSLRWPVLRCTVKDVRFRFPFKSCFRTRDPRTQCSSVVAIVTLEITGIPETSSDRLLPWPSPRFHEVRHTRAGAQTFEVHLFETQCEDYIIPEKLFTWRLETLEQAYIDQNSSVDGLRVVSFFPDDGNGNRREDSDFTTYQGTLLRTEAPDSNDRFGGSGLESLRVEWDDSSYDVGSTSPWAVTLIDSAYEFVPPRLAGYEKRAAQSTLDLMKQDNSVQEWFYHRVDESVYSDYTSRVEVPMYFLLIEERLKANYYSNPLSLVADVKLIRDNCVKYNGENSELSEAADAMLEAFEAHLNGELRRLAPGGEGYVESEEDEHLSGVDRRSLRRTSRNSGVSSLERLPEPPGMEARSSPPASERPTVRSRSSRTRQALSSLAGSGQIQDDLRAIEDEAKQESEKEEDSEGSDEDLDEAKAPPRRPTRAVACRPRRTSRARDDDDDEASVFSEEDSEEEDEEEEPVARRRSTKPSRRRASSRSQRSSSRSRGSRTRKSYQSEEEAEEEEPVARRRSTKPSRKPASSRSQRSSSRSRGSRTGKSYESEEEAEEYASASDEDEEASSEPERRSRRSPRKRRAQAISRTPESSSPRRTTRHRQSRSMADLSHSDFDEDDQEVEEDEALSEDEQPRRPRKRRSTDQRSGTSKKARLSTRSQDKIDTPDLKEWPDVNIKQIGSVGGAVMDAMSALDTNGIFAIPVVEAIPSLSKAYKKKIKDPMDFRTIAEERILRYEHIKELQNDLILVFRNALAFNGHDSDVGKEALLLWSQINDVFRNACIECGVMLPRRW